MWRASNRFIVEGKDPVKLGLVASLARPGGKATGINDFLSEVDGKRLRLLHDLVPKTTRIAVLVNPANVVSAEGALQGAQEADTTIGRQIRYYNRRDRCGLCPRAP
jgi:putative tryptophan/tyrosine transport system substrate-binding protein